MIVYFNNTQIDLAVNDNSYRYRAIKGEQSLTLYYSLSQHIEIPLGAYCVFEGETYTLESPENFKKYGTRNFEYTLIMEAAQAKLSKYKFKDTTTRRLKFSLTAKPKEHLQMLVDNLNQRESGWVVGKYSDAVEKVISYNHAFCSDALSQIAEAFETEWEITGKTINLCKVEYNKSNPLLLSYGRGNGFKSGIGRTNGDKKPVEILFVQGGDRNIDVSKYGSSELLLPKNQTISYDGEYFSDQPGYNAGKSRKYITDADGFSLRCSDKPLSSQSEDSLDCSHIYPSRIGTISSVNIVDVEKHFYDIIDNSIPANLNFENCLIEGEKMTIIFQSGMLSGKEFDVKYIHANKRFEIVPQEIDGRTMPDEIFKPKVGEKYAVFGMMMPKEYICDDTTKSGASWDMFREAVKYKFENEEQKFTFTGEMDGIWAKKDWLNIGGKIKLGGYVQFSDNQFQPNGVLIRIVGIKDYINSPHSPQIELSNEIVGNFISSDLRKIETNEIIVDDLHKEAIQYAKRRFRDSQETIGMLESALLDKFTNSINPIAVQTMAMLVGDESLQFRFVNNIINPVEVSHTVVYNTATKILTAPAGIIQHLTLGIKSLSSTHAVNEYKFWTLPAFNTPALTDGDKKYYLYAKVSKTANTGVFYISETAIAMESIAGYYHLLMGILNSEYDGDRGYVSLYGYTEILPGRVTTEKVISSDGQNFLDFVNNAFRVGNSNNSLSFNTQGDGKLLLKGTLVQSQSGDTQPLGCFRGAYDSLYLYYKGDEVTYNGSTHRYINDSPTKGHLPTDTVYWAVVSSKGTDGANGADGKDGINAQTFYTWIKYADSATGSGLSDSPMGKKYIGFAYNKTTAVEGNNSSDYIWSLISGTDGVPGEPGKDGQTTYTWIKYSDYADGRNMYDIPTNQTEYIGIAVNKLTATESNTPSDYTWSKFKGDQGVPGTNGTNGTDGAYFEYRYAKNGSTSAPPALTVTSANPSGWTTTVPSVGVLEYLWMIVSKKSAAGALLQNWSTPIRTNGADGAKGDKGDPGAKGDSGPSVVFRGDYNSSATYYGTSTRVDCVKYSGLYYVSRVDAGNGFTGIVPTNTGKWNTFGAQFDSVATNLLLAEMANIGDWIIKDGKITSQHAFDGTLITETADLNSKPPKAQLDGANGALILASSVSDAIAGNGIQKIILDSNNATIRAEMNTSGGSTYGGNGVAAINSQGILANRAGTYAVAASSGVIRKGAIIGLGYGNVAKNADNSNFMCGVYGIALNSNANPAPSFGGYFSKLKANGLYLGCKRISGTTTLTDSDVFVSCYNTSTITVNLPADPYDGQMIMIRINNGSAVTVSGNGKQMMHPNGSIVNSVTATVRGEFVTLIWDGQYWLYSTNTA